jgi:hypothetical protein
MLDVKTSTYNVINSILATLSTVQKLKEYDTTELALADVEKMVFRDSAVAIGDDNIESRPLTVAYDEYIYTVDILYFVKTTAGKNQLETNITKIKNALRMSNLGLSQVKKSELEINSPLESLTDNIKYRTIQYRVMLLEKKDASPAVTSPATASETFIITTSTRFGDEASDTHEFTGSVSVEGGFTVEGNFTSSYAETASLLLGSIESASYATSASFAQTCISASYSANGGSGTNFWTGSGDAISREGDVQITGSMKLLGELDWFEETPPDIPAPNSLRLYVEDYKGFSFFSFIDDSGMRRKIVRDSVFVAKASASIPAYRIVYAAGSSEGVPLIALANASSLTTMPAIGISIEAITSGTFGRVMQVGLLEDVNTNAYDAGDVLYVSTTNGVPTKTPPVYPNYKQEIGTILAKDPTSGSIQIIARSMFLENAFWTGSDDGSITRESDVQITGSVSVTELQVEGDISSSGNIYGRDYVMESVAVGSPGATIRYIGNGFTTDDFWYNVPTGGRHRFSINDVEIAGIDSNGIQVGGMVSASSVSASGEAHFGDDIHIPNTYGIKTKTASGTPYRFMEAKSDNRIYLRANSTDGDHLVISQIGGNVAGVGINNSAPASALDVYGTASFRDGAVLFEDSETIQKNLYVSQSTIIGAKDLVENGDFNNFINTSIATASLKGHWVFDETYHANGAVDIDKDISGNGNDLAPVYFSASYSGSISSSISPIYSGGSVLHYDGKEANGQFHSSSASDFQPGADQEFTFTIWLRGTRVGITEAVIDNNSDSSFEVGYSCFIYGSNERIYWRTTDGNGFGYIQTAQTTYSSIRDGNWHLLVLYRSGSGENSRIGINIDAGVGTGLSQPSTSIDLNSGNPFTLGAQYDSTFEAAIDIAEARWYNKLLTDREIAELYGLAEGWFWNGSGSVRNDNFTQVLSGSAEISQSVTAYDDLLYRKEVTGSHSFVYGSDNVVRLFEATHSSVRYEGAPVVDEKLHVAGAISASAFYGDGSTLSGITTISASYAATASKLTGTIDSASYAATASLLLGSVVSSSFAAFATSASYAETASVILGSITSASYAPVEAGFSSSISTRVTTNETDIIALQTDSGSFSTRVTNVENGELTASQAISASYAETASLLLGSVVSASFADTSMSSSFAETAQTLLGSVTSASYAPVEPAYSESVSTRLTTDETDISNLQTDSGSFSTRVTTNETNITNLQTDSGSFSTRITSNDTDISALQTDSGSFSTRVTTNETNITNLQTDSGSFSTRVTDVENGELTASQAISASYAATASLLLGSVTSASFASTALSANSATSASNVTAWVKGNFPFVIRGTISDGVTPPILVPDDEGNAFEVKAKTDSGSLSVTLRNNGSAFVTNLAVSSSMWVSSSISQALQNADAINLYMSNANSAENLSVNVFYSRSLAY